MPASPAIPMSPEEHLLRLLFHVRDTARPDQEGTRGQIAATAIRLFTRLGYGGTSMRAIAAEVGIQAASIYSHFPGGKKQILHEGLRDIYNDFLQHVTATLNPDMSQERQLGTLLERHVIWQLAAGDKALAWDAAYGGLGVYGVLDESELEDIATPHDLYHGYLQSLFAARFGEAESARHTQVAILLCDNAHRFAEDGAAPERTAQLIRDMTLHLASPGNLT